MMNDRNMPSTFPLRLPSIAEEEEPRTPSPPPEDIGVLTPSPSSSGFSPTTVRNTYLNTLAPFATPSPPARRCVLGQPRRRVQWAQPLSGEMIALNRPPGRWSIMKVSTQEQSLWRPAKKPGITKRPVRRALFASTTKLGCAQESAMPEGDGSRSSPISTWRVGFNAAGASFVSGLWTLLAIPGNYCPPTPSSSSSTPVSASPTRVSPLGFSGFATPPPKYNLPVSGGSFIATADTDPFTGEQLTEASASPPWSITSSPFEYAVCDKPTGLSESLLPSTALSPFDSVVSDQFPEQDASPACSITSSPFDCVIGDKPTEEYASPLYSTTSSPFEFVIGDKPTEAYASPLGSTASSPFDSVIGDQPTEKYASPLGSTASSPFDSVVGDQPPRAYTSPLSSDASSPFDSVIGDQPVEDCTSPLYGKSKSYKMASFESPPPQAQMPTKATPEILRRARFFKKHHAEKDAKRAAAALPTPPTSRLNSFSISYRSFAQRRQAPATQPEQSRDEEIENLVKKARHIAIISPQQRRARDAEARAQLQAEEAAARAQAEAKERAATAKKEAEEAAEQARLEAEEAELLEAERKAARKHQIIYPIPSTIASDLEARLHTTRDSHTLLNSIGSFDMKKISYDRILADEGGVNAWLDDETVNAWFFSMVQAIWRGKAYIKTPNIVPPAVAYNTGWWPAQRDKGLKNIAGWSRRQGIKGEKLLSCEKIFFPINTGAHWTLLIVSGTERTIEFLDSFGGKGENERKVARKWLEMELGEKYVAGEWDDMIRTRSQRQSNISDCGMFCCFNGLAAAKQIGYKEVRAEKMREARIMMAGLLYNGGFIGEFEL